MYDFVKVCMTSGALGAATVKVKQNGAREQCERGAEKAGLVDV